MGSTNPNSRQDRGFGEYDYVMPGNRDFVPGDTIDKPPSGDGMGRGGASLGESEDEFGFAISYDEYLNVIFEGLELPDMVKESEKSVVRHEFVRAGHTNVGIPSNLNIERTAIAGISRRIALKAPKIKKIKELEAERALLCDECPSCTSGYTGLPGNACENCMNEREVPHSHDAWLRMQEIDAEISALRTRANAISFLDDVDLRFNSFIKQAKPSTQAVMFCVMDVSGSMGEREKTIAKKFFLLLSLFLRRRYRHIDVVFIRHHETAKQCDEDTFFESRESGGTIVSTAYECMNEILKSKYPVSDWNIYMAQVSDGDNMDYDNPVVVELLNDLLPKCQHFNYIEVPHPYKNNPMWGSFKYDDGLWGVLKNVMTKHKNMDMAQIDDDDKVINVFRSLFSKDKV
jgi:uncharacterized sporulation protein YeaH/YhbH (DUF444 family)